MPQLIKKTEYEGHKQPIYLLSKGLTPHEFFSAGAEGIVAAWEKNNPTGKAIYQADTSIYAMLPLPQHGLLILGLSNGSLVFIDTKNKTALRKVKLHSKAIFDLQAFPDTKHLLASSEDGSLSVWNIEKMKHLHLQKLSSKSIRTILFSPDTPHIYTGSSDHHIRLLNLNLNQITSFNAHQSSVFRLKLTPDHKYLISAGRDAQLNLWEKESLSLHKNIPAHLYAINDLEFHPSGRYLFSGSMDKTIKTWDYPKINLKKVTDYHRHKGHKNGINRLLWWKNGLLSCGDDRKIIYWEFV